MIMVLLFGFLILISIGMFLVCKSKTKNSANGYFGKILNDPRVNSKKVGEEYGIKYFQIIENRKMGFRDLDGNVVIKPKFDNVEMFSEGYSVVQMGDKW